MPYSHVLYICIPSSCAVGAVRCSFACPLPPTNWCVLSALPLNLSKASLVSGWAREGATTMGKKVVRFLMSDRVRMDTMVAAPREENL